MYTIRAAEVYYTSVRRGINPILISRRRSRRPSSLKTVLAGNFHIYHSYHYIFYRTQYVRQDGGRGPRKRNVTPPVTRYIIVSATAQTRSEKLLDNRTVRHCCPGRVVVVRSPLPLPPPPHREIVRNKVETGRLFVCLLLLFFFSLFTSYDAFPLYIIYIDNIVLHTIARIKFAIIYYSFRKRSFIILSSFRHCNCLQEGTSDFYLFFIVLSVKINFYRNFPFVFHFFAPIWSRGVVKSLPKFNF